MDKRQERIFNVLNDWTDMPQDLFLRLWPELEEAARSDVAVALAEAKAKAPLPSWDSEPHEYPCDLFYSSSWTGGGYSGKPLERLPGKVCTCPVDNADLPLDPKPLMHHHLGCTMDGQRAFLSDRYTGDYFEPRDGYSRDENAYS